MQFNTDTLVKIIGAVFGLGVILYAVKLYFAYRQNQVSLFKDETLLRQKKIDDSLDTLDLTGLVDHANKRNRERPE